MAVAKSGSVGTSAATVTVDVEAYGGGAGFSVTNRHDTAVLWVRLDGSAAAAEADNNFPVIGTRSFRTAPGATTVTISIISDTASTKYTVEGKG